MSLSCRPVDKERVRENSCKPFLTFFVPMILASLSSPAAYFVYQEARNFVITPNFISTVEMSKE